MEKLPLAHIQERLTEMADWKLADEKWLIKKYRFRSFLDAVAFVNKIATLSEEENHHPFISIDYTIVTLKLTSWTARGITDLDLKLIAMYDRIYLESKD